jgi:hypothetical protein
MVAPVVSVLHRASHSQRPRIEGFEPLARFDSRRGIFRKSLLARLS